MLRPQAPTFNEVVRNTKIAWRRVELPAAWGVAFLAASAKGLAVLELAPASKKRPAWLKNFTNWVEEAEAPQIAIILQASEDQLREFLTGERREFDLPLHPLSGTAFQQRVWQELRRIPFGKTCSYSDLARRLGKPGASRAIGQANGRNPIPVIVPCHRVIAADGGLGGFSSGLHRKRALLKLEGHSF